MTPFAQKLSRSALSAQEFLLIEAIRDGIVILKKGLGLRAVLMVSALNFALKSEEEQDAIIFQYANFLNSIDFPLQFVVQSRRLNIQPYLETLAERQKEETNELLAVQIGEYIEFIKSFVDLTQIVSKNFYVVVPFQPTIAQQSGILRKLIGGGKTADEDGQFAQFKSQLEQRVDAVSLGLRRLGLRIIQLNTEELIELFYGLYNPTESQAIRMEENAKPKAENAQL